MSANSTAEVRTPVRPKVVDYAVYALIIRCVCSVGAAFALYGARGEITRSLADANKDKHWSAETLRHNVDAALRANLITTLVMVALVAVMIKLIRDGRGWARWLYLAFALLITRDVFQVLGFVQYHHLLTRILTGLVGLSSLAALALLFLPEANAYFRPNDGSTGLLGSFFRPRTLAAARANAAARDAHTPSADAPMEEAGAAGSAGLADPTDTTGAVDRAGEFDTAGGVEPAQAGRRPAPRGKSRQSGQAVRSRRR